MRLPIYTFAAIALLTISCEDNDVHSSTNSNDLIGGWRSETVFLNGVNSDQYADFLNDGSVFVINNDNTFNRNYVLGSWQLCNHELKLKRGEGLVDWNYTILEHNEDRLTLEVKLTESQYCCDFDAFGDNEVITIKEVYNRLE